MQKTASPSSALSAAAAPGDANAVMIKMLPRVWKGPRTDVDVQVSQLAPGKWRIRFAEPEPLPDFYAGILEGRGKLTAEIVERLPHSFELLVQW